MNKKIKNIASVVQTKSAAVLCTLCAVLFLASCDKDEMADSNHSQKQELHTVSVNFSMPGDKPGFGEGTASRALEAEADSIPTIQLEFAEQGISRAEGQAFATTTPWESGNVMLAHIVATNGTTSTEGKLTLVYTALPVQPAEEGNDESTGSGTGTEASTGYWTLIKNQSYTKYGDAFVKYNADDVLPLFVEDTENENWAIGQSLTMRVDETVSVPTEVTMTYIYAPDMEWNADANLVQKQESTSGTTAPEKWMFEGTAETPAWSAIARLRVNTGAAGDEVKLISTKFNSAWEVEPTSTYTATTDEYGNAYFYGITDGTLDGSEGKDFIVELTKMRVAVPQPAAPPSETRSIALDNAKKNFIITLDEPITLLEASDLVPVTLAADNAYKLMANVKRTASAQANLCVIDGQCGITERTDDNNLGSVFRGTADHVAFVLKQIQTAVAAGVTEFTVINELAVCGDESAVASTVVGEAIRQYGSNSSTKISITLADATEVLRDAFKQCTALQSVSAPKAITIGESAFIDCTGLTKVVANNATSILSGAFNGCISLQSVTLPAATTIAGTAFQGCTSLTSLTFGAVVTTVGDNAFNDANTTNCDLTLHADQQAETSTLKVTAVDGQLMWAGKAWKSIKVGETQYAAVGNLLCELRDGVPVKVIDGTTYAVIDGQDDYSVTSVVVNNAVGLTPAITNFYVINQLAAYTGGTAGTVVGEAIYQLAPSVNPASTRAANFTGEISLVLADATSVPDKAFYNCAVLKTVEVGNNVPNTEITLGANAFGYATITTSVTFHKVVTGAGLTNAFTGATITNCTLYLNAEQTGISMTWAGAAWQSITLSDGTKYTIENGVPTVEVDGTIGGKTSIVADDVTAMKSKIKVVADVATTEVPAKVIVKNELAAYTNENGTENDIYAGTVVGEAIRQLTPSEEPMGTETVNYNGRITLTLDNATELPEIAFAYCNALQNVSAPNATEIGPGAFISCTALTSVSLPVATTIGVYAFRGCALTNVNLDKVTQIGSCAFYDVTLANLEIGANAATDITLGEQAFTGSTINGHVKFHKVVTGDGITQMNAFESATFPDSGLDLYLAAGQPAEQITASGGQLIWADKQWKSITVGEIEFKAVGDELYMLIADDGYLEYPEAWGEKIKKAIDSYNLTSVYVTGNSLSIYNGNQAYRTVVGEAILSLGESYNGRISLVLAEAAAIPANAFSGCKALQSVVANNATTIGVGAFYECTQITAITFGTVITGVGNNAFGQTIQADAPWTISCALNLAAGQDSSAPKAEYSYPYWAEYEWGTIKVGDVTYYPGGPI